MIARIIRAGIRKDAGPFLCAATDVDKFQFSAYTAGTTRQEIKTRLLNAIQHSPHLRDIKSAAIFGSYANGSPAADSDIDVLMEFTDGAHIGFFEYARIQRSLSESLGIQVDLVTPEALSKFIRPQVLQEAQSVYKR